MIPHHPLPPERLEPGPANASPYPSISAEFARRYRLGAILVVSFSILVVASSVLSKTVFITVVVIGSIVVFAGWALLLRCPSCNTWLGSPYSMRYCPSCGVYLGGRTGGFRGLT